MFFQLVCTEIVKYKRTVIPWLVMCGGSFAAFVAFLMVLFETPPISWEALIVRGMNLVNILALLLVAVFSGYVFTNEFHNHIKDTVFTYPVSRLKIYLAKCFSVLLMVLCFYVAFLVLTVFFGVMGIGGFPSTRLFLKFAKFVFILSAVNFALAPVTALISIVSRSAGSYVITGMVYFMIYVSFFNSDYSCFIPPCMPDSLTLNYFVLENMNKADLNAMITVLSITFISAACIGAYCYSRADI